MSVLLRNGSVLTDAGMESVDVLIEGSHIAAVGGGLDASDAEIVDCEGSWVGPGFVDLHAHLREPGEEWKEDIASASSAAAAGGYTAVVAMPNTSPPVDDGHHARFVIERGRAAGHCEVVTAGCLTEGRGGMSLAHYDALWEAGVRIFTDDGDCVMDSGLLRRAMEYVAELGGVVAQHAEDAGLVAGGHMNEGAVSAALGMLARPAAAEEIAMARDLALVRLTGVRYHALHVSTARSVQLIAEAKADGLAVTAEVTPHHLFFDDGEVRSTDPVYKMNPPLRPADDRDALRRALGAGVIDAVATDHAPHADFEKDVPFEEAPAGVIGLETAAAAVATSTPMSPADFYERMSVAPARIAGLDRHGRTMVRGAPANIAVFDPAATWTPAAFRSKAANSPFRGRTLTGRVRATVYEGHLAPATVGV